MYVNYEVDSDTSIAKIWNAHQLLLPKLAKLVKSVCCGPSSTVASEYEFSMGANFVWAK